MTNNLNPSDAASGGGKSDLETKIMDEAELRYPVKRHSNPKDSPYGHSQKTFLYGVRYCQSLYTTEIEELKAEIQRLKEEIKRLTPDLLNSNPASFEGGVD